MCPQYPITHFIILLALISGISLSGLGCGFDFTREFGDTGSADVSTSTSSDTGSGADGDTDTDTDSYSDADADTDADVDSATDTEVMPTPDFSLVGFATVAGNTTGGAGGTIVTATDSDSLRDYLLSTDPLVIRIESVIALSERLDSAPNKTIEGIGSNAGITGFGIRLIETENIIVRNLQFSNIDEDALAVEETAHHIWIDHNDLSASGDGLVDIKGGASYITVSWNRFHDQKNVSLIGASDDTGATDIGNLKVTVHHNWYRETEQQHPRCRFGEVHVFNNYYENITAANSYVIASTTSASVLSESNYFLNTTRPFSLAEGSSPEGFLRSRNDIFVNCGEPVQSVEDVFNPAAAYTYSPDEARWVPDLVQAYAGPGVIDPTAM